MTGRHSLRVANPEPGVRVDDLRARERADLEAYEAAARSEHERMHSYERVGCSFCGESGPVRS